jgi:hypothetical protein
MTGSERLNAIVRFIAGVPVSVLIIAGVGCSVSPEPTPIYKTPGLSIQLAYDPQAGQGHTHPATVPPEHMSSILHGLQLRGRDLVGGLGVFGDAQRSLAFTTAVVAMLAPHLSAGLAKASPSDLVTFHLVQGDAQGAPLVTSGGVFVRNRHLYVILANARTSPSAVQYENVYEPNSRIYPLLPIARFKFVTEFVPADWRIPTADAKRMDGWGGYLDESKVAVIDLGKLNR